MSLYRRIIEVQIAPIDCRRATDGDETRIRNPNCCRGVRGIASRQPDVAVWEVAHVTRGIHRSRSHRGDSMEPTAAAGGTAIFCRPRSGGSTSNRPAAAVAAARCRKSWSWAPARRPRPRSTRAPTAPIPCSPW